MVLRNNRWNPLNSTLIIVEGLTDKGFIEGIAEKLQAQCKVHIMRGNRPEKVSRLLKAFMGEFNKAIILKDLHRAGRDTTTLINKLTSKLKQLESQGLQLQVISVKRSIESWILAGLSVNNPEEILNPEEELKKLMQKKGKQYIKSPEIYKRLAKEEIDIKKAAAKSEAFKNFIEILTT
jgi:hypothetical protein